MFNKAKDLYFTSGVNDENIIKWKIYEQKIKKNKIDSSPMYNIYNIYNAIEKTKKTETNPDY